MNDLRKIYFFARRNAAFISAVAGCVTLLMLTLGFILPKRYMAEAVVILDPRKTRVTDLEEVVSSLLPDTLAIRSDVTAIQSKTVANKVVDKLDLMKDPVLNPAVEGGGRGLLSQLFGSDEDGETASKRAEEERTIVVNNLLLGLDVVNDGRSYSINIDYRDVNPEKAARIANAFAEAYLENQIEVKYDTSEKATIWFNKRLEALQEEVRKAEKAVETFKEDNNLVGKGGDETLTQQQLGAINTQLLDARGELAQAEARYNSVKGRSLRQQESSSIAISSELIRGLKQQEAEVLRQEADMSKRYGRLHPTIVNIRNQLDSIRGKISDEVQKITASIENDYNVAKNKVTMLEKQLADVEGVTVSGNQSMVTLRQLQRQAAVTRTLYESFLSRSKQIVEQQGLQMADSRIVARADIPVEAYFPKKRMFLLLGIFLGGGLGTILAFGFEYLNRGVRSLGELEELCGINGLGVVPVADAPPGQPIGDYILEKPLSGYAESIRAIATAIHFSNVDAPHKIIMVTSSLPKEGKSCFATSLTRVIAQSGKKVLLIDADLRRPSVHSLLGLDITKPDLAMVLAHDAKLEDAIQRDTSGADVIVAHTKVPNPHDLLSSHQMELLLIAVREKYDIVIIDSPPIMAVADSAMMAKQVDTALFLVRWGSTTTESVAEGLKKLRLFNVKLAGAVLTQVDMNEQRKYGFGSYEKYKHYYQG